MERMFWIKISDLYHVEMHFRMPEDIWIIKWGKNTKNICKTKVVTTLKLCKSFKLLWLYLRVKVEVVKKHVFMDKKISTCAVESFRNDSTCSSNCKNCVIVLLRLLTQRFFCSLIWCMGESNYLWRKCP